MNRTVKKAQSVVSDQETNDGLAEIELQKLQRQCRIMEGDRKAYSEESRAILKKQKNAIDQLKNDNETLKREIQMLESRMDVSKSGSEQTRKARSLEEQIALQAKKMKNVQETIDELDKKISDTERAIVEQRKTLGGLNATNSNNAATQKQIRVLENRLDKALIKFNKSLANNKELRDVIDNLRRERAVFETVYRKLERELNEHKKKMADIIEATNNAYENRDEAQAKMIALKEKAEKEFLAYTQEIKELDRVLEQDRKFKSFMAVKNSQRLPNGGSATGRLRKSTDKDNHKGSQENISINLEDYDLAFEKIKKDTNVSNVSELVSRFTELEDHNFSLFNYVNEINNEMEMTNEEILRIQKEIESYHQNELELENERSKRVQSLEAQLQELNNQTSSYEGAYQKIGRLFDEMEQVIGKITSKIGAIEADINSKEPSEIMVQGDKSYLIKQLGVIESKTNDLIISNYLATLPRRTAEEKENSSPIQLTFGGITSQGPINPITSITIPAPTTGDDFDSDGDIVEDLERPLSLDELRLKSLKGIAKREKSGGIGSARTKKKILVD